MYNTTPAPSSKNVSKQGLPGTCCGGNSLTIYIYIYICSPPRAPIPCPSLMPCGSLIPEGAIRIATIRYQISDMSNNTKTNIKHEAIMSWSNKLYKLCIQRSNVLSALATKWRRTQPRRTDSSQNPGGLWRLLNSCSSLGGHHKGIGRAYGSLIRTLFIMIIPWFSIICVLNI